MRADDLTADLVDRVRDATARCAALRIVGGDTRRFLGRAVDGDVLAVGEHSGIVNYDPAELVVTARAGTPVREIEASLAAHGQHLPFEPPCFGPEGTLGGAVASGLAGPARPSSGPLRDYVLGVRVLTGDGRVLRFGGEVMKNVAGYDVARLMAGAFGTLGVLLEVSLKVLPLPPEQRTLVHEATQAEAIERLAGLSRTALPLTASCWSGGRLYMRFAGTPRTLDAVSTRVGGSTIREAAAFWSGVRRHEDPFFASPLPLWRLIVPVATAPLPLPDEPLVEWHGSQRWYRLAAGSDPSGVARTSGGFATCFRNVPAGAAVFAPVPERILSLHRALKQVFDPACILNPGRMYDGL